MRAIYFIITSTILLFGVSCSEHQKPVRSAIKKGQSLFTEDIRSLYFQKLDSASHYMALMDTANPLDENRQFFLESRKWYKRAEPLMMGYDYPNYTTVNSPNLLKVEIDDFTDIKKIKPHSYQVLEELLYGEEAPDQTQLASTILFLQARLPFIRKNHMLYRQWDQHHLKMIRDAIINVATKGITGFDSPMLANSLQEAIYNYETISEVIDLYQEAFADKTLVETWLHEIDRSIQDLAKGDFDSFDRYEFIKRHTHTQLELINQTAQDWGINLNSSRALNPTGTNLFSTKFFNNQMFAPPGSKVPSSSKIELGKALFNDKTLSSTGQMNCGSCHLESKAFTDGLPKAVGNGGELLQRNSPTLSYALFQKTFFYDGRGDGLEGQIVSVLNNENEFHLDLNTLEAQVGSNEDYQAQFKALYDDQINHRNIRNAIATYIRSLAPFNAKFDRNMQGLEETLTKQEILGFNLFMGKAACATCHFPPAFNGTVPPRFGETEFENLGVPANASFAHPTLDDDPGAYFPYEVEERRHFFKTSTVRNIELTAPYMHNGVYQTLEEVMKFYNVGGGQGMGLDVPYQTLPPDSLNLSDQEIKAIISFMKTLTDEDFVAYN